MPDLSRLLLLGLLLLAAACTPSAETRNEGQPDTTITHGGTAPADNTATEADQAGIERPKEQVEANLSDSASSKEGHRVIGKSRP